MEKILDILLLMYAGIVYTVVCAVIAFIIAFSLGVLFVVSSVVAIDLLTRLFF